MRKGIRAMGRDGDGISITDYDETRDMLRWREIVLDQKTGTLKIKHRKSLVPKTESQQVKAVGLARMGKKAVVEKTLSQVVPEYLRAMKRQKAYYDKTLLCKALVSEFGDMPLSAITPLLVEQYQAKLLDKALQPSTVNHYTATLGHIFTKAVKWKYTTKEVSADIHIEKLKVNNGRLRYLSKEEASKLLAMCRVSAVAYYLYPIVVIALNTGMRKGEILSLEWRMIDFKTGFVRLEDTKNGEKRNVPLNNTVIEVLKPLARAIDDGKIFAGSLRHWGAFELAVRKAGIKDFHFHDLRHTFASWMVMAGVDIYTLKDILGHKTISMTLRYAHLAPTHGTSAVRLLDANNASNAPRDNEVKVVNL